MKKKVQAMCSYNGHSIGNNGNVNLRLKCAYSELVNYIQLIQMLNNDTSISAKPAQESSFKLGTWRIKEVKIDHDGEGLLVFNSMTDFVEVNNLNNLITSQKGEEIKVTFESDIELEDDDEDWG